MAIRRREFLAGGLLLPLTNTLAASSQSRENRNPMKRTGGPKIGISLNAYSFNDALRGGRLTLDELL
jgi:hypothetical protein